MLAGKGVLVKACLTAEEREKMYAVDERLRLLREESDKYYKVMNWLLLKEYVYIIASRDWFV